MSESHEYQLLDMRAVDKLKGKSNYELWKFQVQILLEEKGALKIATGEDPKPAATDRPDDTKSQEAWTKKDVIGKRIIFTTLEKTIMPSIMSCNSSAEMWVRLKNLYGRNQEEQKQELIREFFSIKFERGTPMTQHVSKIQNIFAQLKAVDQTVSDEMLMSKILTTLPESMESFVTSWDVLSINEKTVERLVSKLLLAEERLKTSSESGVAFSTSSSLSCYRCHQVGHLKRNCTTVLKCENCGKGHLTQYCRNKKGENSTSTCSICNKGNHSTEKCWHNKANQKGNAKKNKQNSKGEKGVAFSLNKIKTDGVESDEWIVDSGATSHLTNNLTDLSDVKNANIEIGVAKKGNSLNITKIGQVCADECSLTKVLFSDEAAGNLLSVKAITEKGGTVLFTENEVLISKDNVEVLKGEKGDNGLYTIKLHPKIIDKALSANVVNDAWMWHKRLGHIGAQNMCKLLKLSEGMNLQKQQVIETIKNCEVCILAKQTRLPFENDRHKASRPLEIIHSDVCYVSPPTWDNKQYFVTFEDDFSGFVQIYLLGAKSEVSECAKEYVAEVEAKFNLKISKLRSDNGGEYESTEFKKWCKNRGIILDRSTPYTPQLNGTAERLNRTILDKARAMILESKLDKEMWGEAVLAATYVLNRSPKANKETTPFELWFNRKPNLKNLRIFGSTAYAKILTRSGKFEERSEKLIFVGYCQNGYRLWDKEKREIVLRRDVKFIETNSHAAEDDYSSIISEQDEKDDAISNENSERESEHTRRDKSPSVQESDFDGNQSESELDDKDSESSEWLPESDDDDEDPSAPENPSGDRRYPDRPRQPPVRYPEQASLADRVIPGCSGSPDPQTYNEALASPEQHKWQAAINAETAALKDNKTWVLVNKNEAKTSKILSSKWVFRTKEDGTKKARLVVRGFEQGDIDYGEIFSPVASISSIRTLLVLAVERDMNIAKFDIKSAFINAELQESVFMYIPQGFEKFEGKICKLNKALYGLKQSPQAWNTTLTQHLVKQGFKQLKTDSCIFKNKTNTVFISIHVDDGLVVFKCKTELDKLINLLGKDFDIKTEVNPTDYLGIEIKRGVSYIKISQSKYTDNVLKTFNMYDAKSVETPMIPENVSGNIFETGENQIEVINFPYRKAVGSLLYLSNKTRPDIAFATNVVSRHLDNPDKSDVIKVKRILRYLKGTMSDGIIFEKSGTLNLNAYSDADYGGDLDTRRSTTGYVIFIGNSPVCWSSRRQHLVATSSAESELMAAFDCVKTLAYMRNLMLELIDEYKENILYVNHNRLFIDNQSTIKLIKNGVNGKRSKHMDIRFHFIKEKVERNKVEIKYISTDRQIADILTKPLQKIKFNFHKQNLALRGCVEV